MTSSGDGSYPGVRLVRQSPPLAPADASGGYFLWGPGTTSGQVVIAIGESEARLRSMFDEVSLAATSDHQYAMPHERHTEIFVCRAPKRPWRELWPTLKHYR